MEGQVGVGIWAVGHIEGPASSRVTSTGGEVNILALGEVSARVEALADATILSEGNVNASLSAGKDAFVLAYGDVSGNYHADRDASVITYGNFNAGLDAGRDIGRRQFGGAALPGVWARGDISGTITADRNVGYDGSVSSDEPVIKSYGDINAVILAYNTTNDPNGGIVGAVHAWGSISGFIGAAHSVGSVPRAMPLRRPSSCREPFPTANSMPTY